MKRLHPTRGVYDLMGVEGAAGPVQFFGAMACLAAVLLASSTFRYGPFTAVAILFLVFAHGFSLYLRKRISGLDKRLIASGALAVGFVLLVLLTPSLARAVIAPDMHEDSDYALAGALVWIALLGQCFASAPGVLIFMLLPELASMAVFGQLNISVEMPACYALYLASALGLLSYANFLRRPFGSPVRRRIVLPGARDMMFSLASLFLILSVGAGLAAVVLEAVVPSPFSRDWLTGYFFQNTNEGPAPFDSFTNQLDLSTPGAPLQTAPVLRVQASRPVLLRRRVYAQYTGHGWLPTSTTVRFAWAGGNRQVGPNEVPGRPDDAYLVEHEVELLTGMRGSLPVAGMPVYLSLPHSLGAVVHADGVVRLTGSAAQGTRYGAVSAECPSETPGIEDLPATYDLWVLDRTYLQLPPESTVLADLAESITRGESSVASKARAIQRYLEREMIYNLDAPAPDPEEDAAVDFLLRRKQGICTDFATAMAVLCRLSGMPARLVTGYAASEPDPEREGWYLVRAKDAHAWVEVYIPGMGWATFDPQADREIEGSSLQRLIVLAQRSWRGLSRLLSTNLLLLALLIPISYIVFYQTRRIRPRHRSARWVAGTALRQLNSSLQFCIGWRSPGTTTGEHLDAAEAMLRPELMSEVEQCVDALRALCFAREEPDKTRLRAELKRYRRCLWGIRLSAVRKLREDLHARRQARAVARTLRVPSG